MNKTIKILSQIYEEHLFLTNTKNENYSVYSNFVNVTSNKAYVEKLRNCSAKLSLFYKMLPYYLPPRAPTFNEENIFHRCVATVDFEELGLTAKSTRLLTNKQLREFNLAYHLRGNRYFVNPFYINNFNINQFENMLVQVHRIFSSKDNEELLKSHLSKFKLL